METEGGGLPRGCQHINVPAKRRDSSMREIRIIVQGRVPEHILKEGNFRCSDLLLRPTSSYSAYAGVACLSLKSASRSALPNKISFLFAASVSALRRVLPSRRVFISTRDISFSKPSPALSVGSKT